MKKVTPFIAVTGRIKKRIESARQDYEMEVNGLNRMLDVISEQGDLRYTRNESYGYDGVKNFCAYCDTEFPYTHSSTILNVPVMGRPAFEDRDHIILANAGMLRCPSCQKYSIYLWWTANHPWGHDIHKKDRKPIMMSQSELEQVESRNV